MHLQNTGQDDQTSAAATWQLWFGGWTYSI